MIRRAILSPLVLAGVGLSLGAAQAANAPKRALFAYLAAFTATLTVAVGALLLVMIAHTARAHWFVVLRRLAGAVAATLPVFPVLFLPIALGVRSLYPWAGPLDALSPAQRAWALHAHPWLSAPFFVVRSYLYLGVWCLLAVALERASTGNDKNPSPAFARRERRLSAAGLPAMALTMTAASFDWVMSLDAQWSSDMMGVYLFAGAFAGAVGTTTVAAWLAHRARLLPAAVGPAHFHALGRLLFVSVVFWAYIAFCQFLLVWIADLPRESSFYVDRGHGAWGWAAGALVFSHFALPFLALLSRSQKRRPARLAMVGGWLVLAHALDVYWLVVPAFHAGMEWLDLAFLFGVGGACVAFGIWRYLSVAPYPLRDPALAESLRYEAP